MDAQTAMSLFSKELLSYDSHVGQNDMFYYNLPYERNYELTNTISITPVSGNVIKFYQYRMDKPVRIFTDVVDTTAKPAAAADADSDEFSDGAEGEFAGDEFYDEDGNLRELSEEEMAALLTSDTSSSDDAESSSEFSSENDYSDDDVYDKAPSGPANDASPEEAYDKEPSNWSPEEF